VGNATTLDGTGLREALPASPPARPTLVLVWCASGNERLGEILSLSEDEPSDFGRGDDDAGEGPPRAWLVRERPGRRERRPAIDNPFLSRRQLRLEQRTDGVAVENLGKRPILVDGREAESGVVVGVGQTLEIKSQLLFYCARRAPLPPLANRDSRTLHVFGEPDEHGIVGESPVLWELRDRIAFIASCTPHVLLLGESGAGKELVAQAIHLLSSRRGKRLVARNAATVPSGLADAELFGNVASYPNPGMPERPGLIGEADGSTLFLDEIGELPVELQSHLLRVLDGRGEYQRLGDARGRHADIRLIAATNRSIDQLKHDLAARLSLRLTVPGLGDRREDIPLVVRHLLRRRAKENEAIAVRFLEGDEPRVSMELTRALVTHDYNTHVRELEGLLWNSLGGSRGGTLQLTDDVASEVKPVRAERAPAPIEVGEDQIREALTRHNGVQERVWRELGMANRYVLHRLMKKYGIG
jgi:DNA-binding NtrC family response regulator